MKISQDVRNRFAGDLDPELGMKQKSAEFLELGASVYVDQPTT
jgi:phosphomethylpyrimidine synthase